MKLAQSYQIVINQGFAQLKPYHNEATHNFYSNIKVVDFVNTLIDEKSALTTQLMSPMVTDITF